MSTTTVQEILNRALAMSVCNDPGHIIKDEEAVFVVRRKIALLYVRARSKDPYYYADPQDVDPASGKWAVPAGVAVLRIEAGGLASGQFGAALTEGTEIHRVPLDDRIDGSFPPRVYRVGRYYYTVGETGDPSATLDQLRLYVTASAPVASITTITSTLPAEWPEAHDDLVALQLAIYMSLKDKARGDMGALLSEEASALELFDSQVEGSDPGVKARFVGRGKVDAA